jgi:hypothetical protein
MFQKLIRDTGSAPVVHLFESQGIATCGRHVGLAGVWIDDDRKLTCPDCCNIRDGSDPLPVAATTGTGTAQPLPSSSPIPAHLATGAVGAALRLFRIDFAPADEQPSLPWVLLASIVAILGSLAVDALLVAIGKAVFPSTRHYAHFQFDDYARLTVVGVFIACVAWPIAARVSSAPRVLFLRLAVLVTVVLWLPDLYILRQGQPPHAVGVLMLMHLAIAVVTYNALVRIASVRHGSPSPTAPV